MNQSRIDYNCANINDVELDWIFFTSIQNILHIVYFYISPLTRLENNELMSLSEKSCKVVWI